MRYILTTQSLLRGDREGRDSSYIFYNRLAALILIRHPHLFARTYDLIKKEKHLVWCPILKWMDESICVKYRDPKHAGECYHCMRTKIKKKMSKNEREVTVS